MTGGPTGGAKFLRIRVRKKEEEIVNINLPLKLFSVFSKFIPEEELEKHGIKLESLIELAKKEIPEGKIVDIHDKKDDTHVEIYLE